VCMLGSVQGFCRLDDELLGAIPVKIGLAGSETVQKTFFFSGVSFVCVGLSSNFLPFIIVLHAFVFQKCFKSKFQISHCVFLLYSK
jgi:hypothetical protein